MCHSALQPELIYVLNNTVHDHDVICSLLMHEIEHCNSTLPSWTVDIPPGKPAVNHPEIGDVSLRIMLICFVDEVNGNGSLRRVYYVII